MSSHRARSSFGTGHRAQTVLAALAVTLLAPLAATAQCTVTTLADTGTGSLRACIAAANTASDGEIINFAPTLIGGTITAGSTLSIAASMTISGPGANLLTISGGNAVQIFNISSGTVTISGLTIANGNAKDLAGGAISSFATLTVTNCTFAGNVAQIGGAIFNETNPLAVSNSTFSGNTSGTVGGAISVYSGNASLTVTTSTFTGNTAGDAGAGIAGSFVPSLTVTNSTISGNAAVNHGGGILSAATGPVTLNNSIVAGNTPSGDDCFMCGGQSTNNLIGGTPQLSSLGWYGGATQTMLPLPGSPAIGAGLAPAMNPINTDQRSFSRPTTGAIDLGAVETNYLIVTTTTDVSDPIHACDAAGDSPCSLRDALMAAASGGTDIAFVTGLAGIINLSTVNTPLPALSGNLDLFGPGANNLTISGGGSFAVGSVFAVNSGANAAISGITIANGDSSDGGGVDNNATLTVSNSAFFHNGATMGGGVANAGTLLVYNSTFAANSGATEGGGIFNNGGTVIATNSTFSGNAGGFGGGGINTAGGALVVNNSTFSGNTAVTDSAGGILNSAGTLSVNNSILTADSGQECSGSGGCPSNGLNGNIVDATPAQPILAPLGLYGGPTPTMLPLPGSEGICAGMASLEPGGLPSDQRGFARTNLMSGCLDAGAVQTNYLIVTTTTDVSDPILACDAAGDTPCSLRDALTVANPAGADIAFATSIWTPTSSNLTINLSTFNAPLPAIAGNLDLFGPGANILTVSGGNSPSVGSVFTVNSGANAALSGVTIANGKAAFGAGAGGAILNNGTLTVSNSAVSRNSATNGGGLFSNGATLVGNSTFSGNVASGYGGGIAGAPILNNSTVSGNIAGYYGGGIAGAPILNNSTVSGNAARIAGGIWNGGTTTLINSIVAGNTTDGSLGSDDCDGCGKQSSFNLIGGNPQLAVLGSYGGPIQTMLPLPGSPAICAGSAALDPGFLLTDERGFPRLNTSYTGFSASTPCLDLGADQTNYQSVQFTNAGNSGYSGNPGVAISTPAAPVVSVTENGQNIGAVPVTLSFMGTAPSSVSGTGPVTTVAGTGATFNALEVSPGGSYTLEALLMITPSVSISGTAALNIDSAATVTSLTSTASGTYTTGAVINITVNFSKAVNVHGIPKLALNSGGTASYVSGTGNSSLVFTYNVVSPQYTLALDASSTTALRLNGGTILDASNLAANLTLPAPGAAGSLSANSAIVVNSIQYQLTIGVFPAGAGTVQPSPTSTPNVTPALPTGTYLAGAKVQLTATANSGYSFSYWTEGILKTVNGAAMLTANPLMFTISAQTASWTAHFIAPPTITKAFMPTSIVAGGTSTLSFSINNPNVAQSLSGIFFRDTFPAGMQVAAVPDATNTCGGTFTAPAGAIVVHLNAGSLAAGASCSMSVSVKGTMAGMLPNITGAIVSSNGGTGATSNTATLTVNNPITLVQAASVDAGATASTSLAFPSANTAGNFIAVVVRAGIANETITVQDSAHNMYLKAVQLAAGGSPGGENLSIYYAQNIAGAANTVTVSQTTPGTLRIAILEESGVATSNALDQTSSAQGRSAAPNAGGVTTTTNGDLLLAGILTVDPEIYTPGTGYTAEAIIPGEPNAKLLVEQRIQTTAGPAGGGATLGSSDPWGAVLAAFHPASNQCVPAPAGHAAANANCPDGPLR